MSHDHRTRSFQVEALTRVEGEGGLIVEIHDGAVRDVRLRIFEPPRFFEAFLRGRAYTEPPDITARICGICPVAYQMSACQAIEQACGVTLDAPLRDLRHLLYCGEWIESHVLHIHLLHAPDFLGYPSGIAMAADHRAELERGLRLKKIGNEIVEVIGGRAVHPVNVKLGGFYKAPDASRMRALAAELVWATHAAEEVARWVATFPIPDHELPDGTDLVALRHPTEYPMLGERLVSTSGLDIAADEYLAHFTEEHVQHSTALHGRKLAGGDYLVGPLARFVLNADHLSPRPPRSPPNSASPPRNATPSAASWCAPSRRCTPAKWRSPSPMPTRCPRGQRWMCPREPVRGADGARPRGGCCGIATSSRPTALSPMRTSCHPRPRTNP